MIMGEIVAAMATCHAPQLFTYPPDEDHAQLDATIAAMRQLGRILDETAPDVLIFLGSDHLETFSIGCVPTFAIVAGSRAIAEFAGRSYDLPVHREMAEDLLTRLVSAGFDMAYSEDAVLGHAFAVPFEFVLGGREIPVVPFHTNVYMPPLPSLQRCVALGREIAGIVASRRERVAILASGGMSHYPGTWKYPQPEFEFDRWLIGELERGNSNALLDLTVEQLDEVGNTELLTWSILFGAIGRNRPGQLLQYTPTWHHGHAIMTFLSQVSNTAPAGTSDAGSSAVYEFRNQGFEFYKHPPASAYKLNKLLFEVRHDGELRRRLLTDLDGVVADWELSSEEREGARAIASVGSSVKVSDNAAALVKAGAHPLQALMSLHAVHGEFRKLLQEGYKE
jgi:aromatic ring-opening dioxygenase catalytic subunit (LigB family)